MTNTTGKRSGQASRQHQPTHTVEGIPLTDLHKAVSQFQRGLESMHITRKFPLEFWSDNFIRITDNGYLSCRRLQDSIYSVFVPYSAITIC